MRYWNPNTKACYVERQLVMLPAHIRENLIEIEESYWNNIVRLVNSGKYILAVDEKTKLPIAEERILSSEERKDEVTG